MQVNPQALCGQETARGGCVAHPVPFLGLLPAQVELLNCSVTELPFATQVCRPEQLANDAGRHASP